MPINLSEEQQLRIIMTFGFDQAKAQQVIQGLRAVGSSTKEMVDSIQKSSGVSQPFAQQMTSELKAMVNVQQAYNKEVDRGRQFREQELNDLKQMGVLVRGQQSISGRGMGPGFAEFMIAMSLRSVPGMMGSPIAEGMMGASSINSAISMFQNMAKESGSVANAALAVVKSLGPVTLAFTGLTTVASILTEEYNKQSQAVKENVARQKEFFELVQTETTASVEREIAALKVKKDAEDKTIAQTVKDVQDLIPEAIASRNKARAGVGMAEVDLYKPEDRAALTMDIALGKLAQAQSLFAALDQLQGETGKTADRMKMLIDVMSNMDVVANDAAAAIVRESEKKNQVEKQIAADYAMTSESATKRVSTLLQDENAQQTNIAAYTAAMNTVKEGTPQYLDYKAKLEAAQEALQGDKDEVKKLTEVIIPLINEREREAEAVKAQAAAYADLRNEIDKAYAAVQDAKAAIQDLDDAYAQQQAISARDAIRQAERDKEEAMWKARIDAAKAAEDAAKAEDKLAKDRAKAEADMAKAVADEQAKEAKLIQDFLIEQERAWRDFATESNRAWQDYLTQRKRDEEDMGDQLLADASERNVLAFMRDKAEAEKKMQREQEDYELAARRRIDDFATRQRDETDDFLRRLADLRAALAQELAERKAALAQQLADAKAAQIQRESEADRLQKMFDNIRHQWQLQDQASKEADELASYQRRRQTLTSHLIEMEAAYANFKFRMDAMMSGAQTGNNQPGYAPNVNPYATIATQSSVSNTVNMNVAAGATMDFVGNLLAGFGNDIISALKGKTA